MSAVCRNDNSQLYAIVNNAAVGMGFTIDQTFSTNVYGCKRVTEAFLPLLMPIGGRVVFISSASGPMFVVKCSPDMQKFFTKKDVTWSEIDALMKSCSPSMSEADYAVRGLGDGSPYGFSKACLNSYMISLANGFPNLRINSCTPGYIDTDLTKGFGGGGKKPPHEGTHAPVFLIMGEPSGSGKFYGSDSRRSPLDKYRSPGDPEYESE